MLKKDIEACAIITGKLSRSQSIVVIQVLEHGEFFVTFFTFESSVGMSLLHVLSALDTDGKLSLTHVTFINLSRMAIIKMKLHSKNAKFV